MDTIACRTFLVAGSDERAAVSGHACVHCRRDLEKGESVMAGDYFRQMSGRVVQSRVKITQG